VRELGVQDYVFFAGFVNDEIKRGLLSLCRAVVLPSHLRSESYGLCLVEGAMAGKPLISAEIGTGTTYINKHCETGFAVLPGDSDTLADAMKKLRENAELAAQMGAAARKRYEAHFTGALMGQRYAEAYYNLLGQTCPQPNPFLRSEISAALQRLLHSEAAEGSEMDAEATASA
jgi:rhamnosyl/mannosyltransferase